MEPLTKEKSERVRIDELNGWSSNRWRTHSDNVVSVKSKGNEERGAGFYRWSAWKTKRNFDPRYKPFDEWHMSCALNASVACQTFIALTASYSINHRPKVLVTVSYTVQTDHTDCVTVHSVFTIVILAWIFHRSRLYLIRHPMNIEPSGLFLPSPQLAPLHKKSMDQMGWRGQLKRIKIEGIAWRA